MGRGAACTPQRPAIGIGAEATVSPNAFAITSGDRPSSQAAATVAANAAQDEPATGEMTVRPSGVVSRVRSDSAMRAATSKPTHTAAANSAPVEPGLLGHGERGQDRGGGEMPRVADGLLRVERVGPVRVNVHGGSRPTRVPSTSSVAWAGPAARTRVIMPLDGTPVPPTAQPSVSRMSRRVASSAHAGISSAVVAQENSLRRRVYEAIAVPPMVANRQY